MYEPSERREHDTFEDVALSALGGAARSKVAAFFLDSSHPPAIGVKVEGLLVGHRRVVICGARLTLLRVMCAAGEH